MEASMWLVATIGAASSAVAGAGDHPVRSIGAGSQMDQVMVLGFLACFFTLVFFIYRRESRAMAFLFATSIAAMALYGALRGVWPLAISEALWSFVAFGSWMKPARVDLSPVAVKRHRIIARVVDNS